MKRKQEIVDIRRDRILDEFQKNNQIKADELAEILEVSPITIRRDLQYLEDQKKLVRYYGGASLISQELSEEDELKLYRNLISEYAANLVEDGDNILINTSMTALHLLKYLGDKHVTVITNNVKALYEDVPPTVNIVLTGGEIRYPKETMMGEFAIRNLQMVSVKKCFVGCDGLTAEIGMTTEVMNEAFINELIFQRAETAYLLADHTKLGHNSGYTSQSIENITHVITDEKASAEVVQQLRARNIYVYQVKKP